MPRLCGKQDCRREDTRWRTLTKLGIEDRFDRTLECIRRLAFDKPHLHSADLGRQSDFLALHGYAEYFLLQGLVKVDFTEVLFFPTVNVFMD